MAKKFLVNLSVFVNRFLECELLNAPPNITSSEVIKWCTNLGMLLLRLLLLAVMKLDVILIYVMNC